MDNKSKSLLLLTLAISVPLWSSDEKNEQQIKLHDFYVAHFECSYYANIAGADEYLDEKEAVEWEKRNIRHFKEGTKLAKRYYEGGLSTQEYIPEGKDVSADFYAGRVYETWTTLARDRIRDRFCPDNVTDCLWTVLTMSEYHDSNCRLLPME